MERGALGGLWLLRISEGYDGWWVGKGVGLRLDGQGQILVSQAALKHPDSPLQAPGSPGVSLSRKATLSSLWLE